MDQQGVIYMPFHKIGEHYPAARLNRGEELDMRMIPDDEVEFWYEEAFLALRNDPYIDFDVKSPDFLGNFRNIAPAPMTERCILDPRF